MASKRVEYEQKALQELLREIRITAGLRQEDVAEKLRVPQSFVSKYESGERRLDILEVRALCTVLGLRLQEFAEKLDAKLAEFQR